ncbi:MAG: hypothetical protein ACLUHA_17715 [Bacteroides stercoris]
MLKTSFTADQLRSVRNDPLLSVCRARRRCTERPGHCPRRQKFNITRVALLLYRKTSRTWTQIHGVSHLKPTDLQMGHRWGAEAAQVIEHDGKILFIPTAVRAATPHNGKAIGVAVSDSHPRAFRRCNRKPLVADDLTPQRSAAAGGGRHRPHRRN